MHDSLRRQLRWVTVAALLRRYDELLQWTQNKHLVVIPTFEAQDMQLAYQTATGAAPAADATCLPADMIRVWFESETAIPHVVCLMHAICPTAL